MQKRALSQVGDMLRHPRGLPAPLRNSVKLTLRNHISKQSQARRRVAGEIYPRAEAQEAHWSRQIALGLGRCFISQSP